ncbi:hypothetical protein VNO77_03825 [Canavalia gladiata]|uniref:Uncharacterized protein n=1 Tax=Canavalia gladiata TaxID=3824 RepID=A0AAN9R8H7_CANGL
MQGFGAITDMAELQSTMPAIEFACTSIQMHINPGTSEAAKASFVSSQLMKKGWLELVAAEKETLFYQMNQAIAGIHGRQEASSSVTGKIIESGSDVSEVKVGTAAMDLMLQILNQDFRFNTNGTGTNVNVFSAGARHDADSPKRSECHLVQPGLDEKDVLISSGHVGWLLSLYAALRWKFTCGGYWLGCPAAWVDPPDAASKAIECGKVTSSWLVTRKRRLEAGKHVMDIWIAILMSINTINVNALLPSEGIKAAANSFGFIIECELRMASASAFSDYGCYHEHALFSFFGEHNQGKLVLDNILAGSTRIHAKALCTQGIVGPYSGGCDPYRIGNHEPFKLIANYAPFTVGPVSQQPGWSDADLSHKAAYSEGRAIKDHMGYTAHLMA